MTFKNLVSLVMKPYLARTLLLISSSSAAVATAALPDSGTVPAVTRPRTSHGCTVTCGLRLMRLALPDCELVQNPKRSPPPTPAPIGTAQTGVATTAYTVTGTNTYDITSTCTGNNIQYALMVADSDGFNPQTVVRSREPLLSPAWSPGWSAF